MIALNANVKWMSGSLKNWKDRLISNFKFENFYHHMCSGGYAIVCPDGMITACAYPDRIQLFQEFALYSNKQANQTKNAKIVEIDPEDCVIYIELVY